MDQRHHIDFPIVQPLHALPQQAFAFPSAGTSALGAQPLGTIPTFSLDSRIRAADMLTQPLFDGPVMYQPALIAVPLNQPSAATVLPLQTPSTNGMAFLPQSGQFMGNQVPFVLPTSMSAPAITTPGPSDPYASFAPNGTPALSEDFSAMSLSSNSQFGGQPSGMQQNFSNAPQGHRPAYGLMSNSQGQLQQIPLGQPITGPIASPHSMHNPQQYHMHQQFLQAQQAAIAAAQQAQFASAGMMPQMAAGINAMPPQPQHEHQSSEHDDSGLLRELGLD